MKIYFGEKRRGFMTAKGIIIDSCGGYRFAHIMQWKFWGLKFGRKFFGFIYRVDNINKTANKAVETTGAN